MFTSGDRVGVDHFQESLPLLLLTGPAFLWKFAGGLVDGEGWVAGRQGEKEAAVGQKRFVVQFLGRFVVLLYYTPL
jgi:hypothetical protein